MHLQEEIAQRATIFKQLCVDHKVKQLYGFGSSVTNAFEDNKSDIDLLIEIDETDPLKRGNHLLELWDEFEAFFKRRVDLLTKDSIRNPFLKQSIDTTKVLVYDRQSA